jgi:hypothetical protein
MLVASIACVSCSSSGRHARDIAVSAPEPSAGVTDASYDWHGLVLAPFGTLLKDSPVPVHEVLLFHDDAHAAAEVESKDCYAIDAPPPRFVGQRPDQYLLCFDHDRLNRIEASVHLSADDASAVFARACALWLKSTAPVAGGTLCEGRDGGTVFSARLAAVPGEATVPLSMTLSDAAPQATDGRAALPDLPHAP